MVSLDKIEDLISKRKLIKKMMFRFPIDSKEFKELDKTQNEIKKELNRLYIESIGVVGEC